MSIYEYVASQPEGSRRLAAGRLRYAALKILHAALEESGITQSELASKLGIRKSAVNQVFRGDGNVRINTLAEYIHELGSEVHMELAPAGTARANARVYAPRSDLDWVPVGESVVYERSLAVAPELFSRENFTIAA